MMDNPGNITGQKAFIGIDPGVAGGIAVLDEAGAIVLLAKMPDTVGDLLTLLRRWGGTPGQVPPAVALLERVNAGVFGANRRMGATSAFTFGRGIGRLETALQACMIPFDQIQPASWQQALGCRSGGDKNITKGRAQQLFPGVTVTHAVADALLLAETCRRAWRAGNPRGVEQHGEKGSSDAGAEKKGGGKFSPTYPRGVVEGIAARVKAQAERAAGASAPGDGTGTERSARRAVRGVRGRDHGRK